MRTWLTTGCVLVLVGVVSSARVLVPDDIAVGTSVNAGPVNNNDQSMVVSTVQNPHDYYSGGHGNKKHDEETERRAYIAAKYIVPPHAASKFEDAWEDLQKQTYKEYDEVDYFVLRKPKWDNHVYYGYSEWHAHRHAQRHRESHLFEDFADFLDDHDIKWELFMLENLSEDIEDQQQEEHRSLLGLDKVDVSQGSLLQVGRRHKKDKEQDEQDEQDQQDDDWDKNIPDEYRPYIPEKYRPKHKDEEDDTTCRCKSCDCKHCHCDSKGSRCHCHKGRRTELGAAALATLPQDASEEQMLQAYANVQKKSPEDAVHIFIEYFVEPHLREKFIDVWTNAAEETIKEKGNYVYSLRRVLSDNTRLWIYGVWDSWGSYMDHFQSLHIQDLRDFAADKDIVWFVQPMEVIGDDKGRSQ